MKPFVWRGRTSGRWYVSVSKEAHPATVGCWTGYDTWGEAMLFAFTWAAWEPA